MYGLWSYAICCIFQMSCLRASVSRVVCCSRVQRVVLGVAPLRVAPRADLRRREHGEDEVGVGVAVPVPEEHVVVGRERVAVVVVDLVAHRALVDDLVVDLEADRLEPAGDELADALVGGRLGAREEPQFDRLAGLVLADAVAVRVLVAGRVELRPGPGGVERVLLALGRLPVVVDRGLVVVGADDRGGRLRVPEVPDVDDLLLVDRPVERAAEGGVLEHRVPQRGLVRVAVEAHVVEAVQDAADGRQVLIGVQRLELRLGDVPGDLDGAGLEVGGHGVLVLVQAPHDLVGLGRAAPVVLVRHGAHVLAALPLDDLERTGADHRRLVGEGVGDLRGGQLAPDVLGKDGDRHPEHVRLGLAAGELDRLRVERLHRLDVLGVPDVVADLVLDDGLEREHHVVGVERLPVLPLDAFTELERPHLAVGRVLPARRQLRRRLQVARLEPHQVVVVEVEQLEGGCLVPDHRVQVVRFGGPSHVQRGLAGRRRGGR